MTRSSLRLASLALVFVFSSCAVLKKEEIASIRAKNVNVGTVQKLELTEPLLPVDLIELTRRGVSQELIVHYIKKTGVNYLVTPDDSQRMRAAGVSAAVIDLIAKESGKFAADYAVRRGAADPGYYQEAGSGPVAVDPAMSFR